MTVYKVLAETLAGSLVSLPHVWPGETSFAHRNEFGCLRFNAPQRGFAHTDLAEAHKLARVYITARPAGMLVIPSLWRAEAGGARPVVANLWPPTDPILIARRVYESLVRLNDSSADPDDQFFGDQYPTAFPGGFSLRFKTFSGDCYPSLALCSNLQLVEQLDVSRDDLE